MRTFSRELNTGMLRLMDIYEIRKQNLVKLIADQKGRLRRALGMAPAHLSQILSNRTAKNLGDDVARRIEGIEGLPRGWFDALAPDHPQASGGPADGALCAADLVKQMLAKVAKASPKKPARGCWPRLPSPRKPYCCRPTTAGPAWWAMRYGLPTMMCAQPWAAARSP